MEKFLDGVLKNLPLIIGVPLAIIVIFITILLLIKRFVYICNPNEILIFSGRKRKVRGKIEGYRIIFGGWAFKIPFLERVERMDMTIIPLLIEVENAYSKGNIPLKIQCVANVKISNDPRYVKNAIERFLGRDRGEIRRVAKETLEGALRQVVAGLTPEQLNEDRLKFAEKVTQEVELELAKLGLHIDTLKIQSVTDEMDYLNNIGRKRISVVVKEADIAEYQAVREAETVAAEARQQAIDAKNNAEKEVLKKKNELRKIKAELEARIKAEEEKTVAIVQEVRAKNLQKLQELRAQLEKLRLKADEVIPADIDRQVKELQAQGRAATIFENAKAMSEVSVLLDSVWQKAGADAKEIYIIYQLDEILTKIADISKRIVIGKTNIIDDGSGDGLVRFINLYPRVINEFMKEFKNTAGIDILDAISSKVSTKRGVL